jgi:Yip1 domain
LVGMFVDPGKSFTAIKNKSMVLLPLLLVMLGTAALLFWYYQQVDFAWLQDKLLAGKELEPAQREAAAKMMTRGFITNMSIISALVMTPIIYAVIALYFLIVAKVTDIDVAYGKWFAFVAWSAAPNILVILLGAMQIMLTSNGQLTPNQLNPLSLNQLFFHLELNNPWTSLLDSVSVTGLWSMALTVIGFRVWSNKPMAKSIAIVIVPYLVIFGVMALIAFFRSAS